MPEALLLPCTCAEREGLPGNGESCPVHGAHPALTPSAYQGADYCASAPFLRAYAQPAPHRADPAYAAFPEAEVRAVALEWPEEPVRTPGFIGQMLFVVVVCFGARLLWAQLWTIGSIVLTGRP